VLSAVQFLPTVVLIVSVPFLADIALSGPVPGANDNASGVATVLRLADRYGDALDHLDVWVLLPGAQEPLALGSQAWMKRHKRDLDPQSTVVLNVDEVGAGTVRYAAKEGPLLALRQHPRLVALCDQIADEDHDRGRYQARRLTARRPGDAYAIRSRGLPAITISCAGPLDRAPHHHRITDTPEEIDPDALDRAFGFCSELVELIDEEIGPDIAATAEQQELDEAESRPRRSPFTRA
jgi:Zn-dependent M28 family amino/carboxypeptidase